MAQVPNYVPINGLIGYWPYSGNANDESGGGNDGVVVGASLTTDRFGFANSAYYFDGASSIDVLEGFDLSERTTNIWVLNSDVNWDWRYALDNDYSSMTFGMLRVVAAGPVLPNRIRLYQGDGWFENELSNNETWDMCTIVRDGDSTSYYVNGTLLGAQESGISSSPTTSFVGFRVGGRMNNSQYWIGKLDDIGIWSRALSPEEISNLYNGELAVSTQNQQNQAAFKIYPNPSNGLVSILVDLPEEQKQIMVRDALGNLVYSSSLNTRNVLDLDLNGFRCGVYTVEVISTTYTGFKKLVVQ